MIGQRLSEFRRGLYKEDRDAFDRLMHSAKRRVQAGVMGAEPDPFHAMAISMLIAMQKEIDTLKVKVRILEKEIETQDHGEQKTDRKIQGNTV